MRARVVMAALAAAAWTAALETPAVTQGSDSLTRTLTNAFGLTAAERNTLAGGLESARALTTPAADGVGAMGAIWIDARPAIYLQWAEDFADFDRGSPSNAVRRLSSPPAPSDFDTLTLSKDEIRELQRCRVGSCAMQLDAASIRGVAAIDWRRVDAPARATAIVRAMMFDLARRYAESGDAALPRYDDSRRATDVAASLRELIDEEAAEGRLSAELLEYLRGGATAAPPGTTSYLFWSSSTFGLKPTIRLNQAIVHRGARGAPALVATRMLYASHYFHGGVEFRYVVTDPALEDRFALVMVTRTRSDTLTGLAGAIAGGTIRRNAVSSLRAYLRYTKEMVEKRQRAGWSR